MKIITLNLNGIRAAARKGFFQWLEDESPDYICLQELKAQEQDLTNEMLQPKGYHVYFSFAEKKGYSGVGIYSKNKPREVSNMIHLQSMDSEGRYIELAYDKFNLVSLYLPSGSSGHERQAFKFQVLDQFYEFLASKQKENKNIIICGDFNIAHQAIDLKNDKGNKNNSGFLPEERTWMTRVFKELGWVDIYRSLHPLEEEAAYTWWSSRGQAWAKNVGWRIDYQIGSSNLAAHGVSAYVYKEQRFSDHAPLIVNYSD